MGRRIVWAVAVVGAACQRAPVGARRPVQGTIGIDGGAWDLGGGETDPAGDAFPDAAIPADGEAPTSGDGGAPLCPPEADDGGPPIPTLPPKELWGQATPMPVSCAPLPSTLFLPAPGAEVPGAYARCASFAPQRVAQLAVTSDGRRAAMVGTDGVVRIVDVGARTVVGVLAPPRSTVGLAAFSPSGDAILTVALGEREATLWRADTFTSIWTTKLPGQTYYLQYNGTAAFAPDGRSAIVSPGADLFLLDVATGTIRATHASLGPLLDAAYGWNGRRVAVVDSTLGGHCGLSPYGGTVTILDPDTLTAIKPLMTWGGRGSPDSPAVAQMLVAPGADLLLTPGSASDPGMKAFRLSDGARLDPPAVSGLPLVFLPGGVRAVVYQERELRVVDVVRGDVVDTTPLADAPKAPAYFAPALVAASADGGTILVGGRGAGLLGVWRPASGVVTSVCSAEDRVSDEPGALPSISADGRLLAVDWGPEIRLMRRADGSRVSTVRRGGALFESMALSPDARYLVAGARFRTAAFRTSDGTMAFDLGDALSTTAVFDQDGRHLFLQPYVPGAPLTEIDRLDLETGETAVVRTQATSSTLAGLSKSCFVFTRAGSGAWRSCDGCVGPLFAAGAEGGILAPDGLTFASSDLREAGGGTRLWRLFPVPTPVWSYPYPADETKRYLRRRPVALSNDGRRIITGIASDYPCYSGPRYELQVHDVASDALVDTLPPGLTSADAELRVLAYGPQLWCARE